METEYYESDFPVSPGSVLDEELQDRGITHKELATKMGRPAQTISEIINGKKAITPETALGLEQELGIPAYLWIRLEGRYRLALAKAKLRSA